MPSNRRALGDIGNLVSSSSFISDRNGSAPVANPKQNVAERPITRKYAQEQGLQLATAKPLPSRSRAPIPKPVRPAAIVKKKEPTTTAKLVALSDAEMMDCEEPLPNIDEQDVGNQLAVVDYVEDIYSFYRKTESQSCVSPDYMKSQTDINDEMRAILMDWLIEVHLKFKLMPETLFLTVNLIDRYLAMQKISRNLLQLVGVTAMLVAAKYEEIWAPEVEHFEFISDYAYTRDQILGMEKKMLNTLRFNLTVPTPYVFVKRFLKAASADRQMDLLAFFFVELCLTELVALKYCPSLLSAAAVYTARCCLKCTPLWTTPLQRHSGYTEEQLKECATHMAKFHKIAAESSDKHAPMVFKKYSAPKYGEVAKQIKPAKQLLQQ